MCGLFREFVPKSTVAQLCPRDDAAFMTQEGKQSEDFSEPEQQKQNASDSVEHFKESYRGISSKAKSLARQLEAMTLIL